MNELETVIGELETVLLITGGIFILIGALVLQWFHKLGFKLAKVEKSEMPGFRKRFLIQIGTILVGYGLLYWVGKFFEGEGGATNLDALAVVSTITATMLSSISNMYIGMLIMTLIVSILYWVELLIAGKLLASYLTVKTHFVAAIPPVLVIFTLFVLPLILGIVASN